MKFKNPVDEEYYIDGKFMFRLFGRCEMMEGEVMDFIISYWKQSADMKYLFGTGDRVLLTPNTIPVSLL